MAERAGAAAEAAVRGEVMVAAATAVVAMVGAMEVAAMVAAARAVAVRAAAVMAVGARVVGGKEVGTEVKVGGSGAEAAGAHHCNTCCHVSPTGRTGS